MLTPLEPANGETILPLALLKARVRVLSTDEDTDIERMRAQAIDFVERYSGKSLQQRPFQWLQDRFCGAIRLPIGPVESVDGISYYATDGTDTALDAADWLLGADVVQAAIGTSWPHASVLAGSVRVTFTAGYEDAEAEASMLISAVEVAVAALFDNREAPNFAAAMALADSYRTPGL
jgi:uncharacterized phiE125 gp8 family phage protein